MSAEALSFDATTVLADLVEECGEQVHSLESAAAAYQAGDEDAFRVIYDFYKEKLQKLAWRMHNEDIFPELLEVLYRTALRYDPSFNTKFNTYFWKCARNHIGSRRHMQYAQKRAGRKYTREEPIVSELSIDEQRGRYERHRDAQPVQTVSLYLIWGNMDTESTVLDQLADDEAERDVRGIINDLAMETLLANNDLKPREQAVLRLFWQQRDMTLETAGKLLGNITAPAVHSLLRRIAGRACAKTLLDILRR